MSAETIPRTKKVWKELGRDWMLKVYIRVRQRMQLPAHSRAATPVPESSHSTAGAAPFLSSACRTLCGLVSQYQGQGALTQGLNWALIHLCFQCQRQCDENQKMSEVKWLLNLLQTASLHRCWCEGQTWFPEGWKLPLLVMDGFLLTCAGHSPYSPCPHRLNL